MPDAISHDPECVGDILTRWVPTPDSGDFQDLPLIHQADGETALPQPWAAILPPGVEAL